MVMWEAQGQWNKLLSLLCIWLLVIIWYAMADGLLVLGLFIMGTAQLCVQGYLHLQIHFFAADKTSSDVTHG